MTRKERVLREMEQIWREVVQKRTNEEWIKSRLAWEDWESLGRVAVGFAARELKRRKWRGASGGVVPRGYGAEDIAWEVIGEMLAGRSQIVPGWTKERLVNELKRMISGKVRLLHSLKETRLLRNEWDVVPGEKNGELVSVLSLAAGDGRSESESEERGTEVRKTVEAELGSEPELQAVFGCLCRGERKTGEIARALGMTEKTVVLARRRLATRLKRVQRKVLEAVNERPGK